MRIVICFLLLVVTHGSPLRVSEFSAGARQGLIDENGDTPDWIEIENVSDARVELGEWFLSDNLKADRKWQFPNSNLAPRGFLVVFASGKNRTNVGAALHANFKLKAEGGSVVLRGPDGAVSIVSNYPPQVAGVSFGFAEGGSTFTYLARATPRSKNSDAISGGPLFYSVQRPSGRITSTNGVTVSAGLRSRQSITKVKLHYRVMFADEQTLLMQDDGKHEDGVAGDHVYGAIIPAGIARLGEMIRYYLTAEDSAGNASRWPLFANRRGYSAYEGTVVADKDRSAENNSALPIFQFFTRTPLTSSSTVSLFHGGEFYDNLQIAEHGQITRMFPKPGFNLDFPYDHRFRYRTSASRVSDLKILANFPDKSKIRNTLAYDMIAAAGSVAHFAYPIRIEENGKFLCVAEAVEDGDDRWLQRVGLDPHGALYKMYGNLSEFAKAEKKTRTNENLSDIAVLAEALGEHRPLGERAAYAMDNLNIPQCISYLVAMAVISSGDHGHKNYYLFRDSRRTGEWSVLPWDVDLSWGRNWTKTYFDDRIYFDNPLTLYRAGRKDQGRNPVYNIFFDHAPFREMYLRRLRTVVDELFQPIAPHNKSRIETRIHELMDLIDPPGATKSDADLDSERWPSWGTPRSPREEAARIINEYLPARREFLLNRATLRGDRLPAAQSTNVNIRIAEVRDDAASDLNGGSIRLENLNAFAVDLTNWELVGRGISFQFHPGTVIPAKGSLAIVANVQRYRASPEFKRGAEFVQGNWNGTLRSDGELRLRRTPE